jgi:hypothetical protein
MVGHALRERIRNLNFLERLTIGIWSVLVVFVCIRGAAAPHSHSCWHVYYQPAGLNWWQGNELYGRVADTCRYSPLIHAGLAPLARMPERLGGLLWRLLNTGVFLAGMWAWSRHVLPVSLTNTQRALLFLLTLPLVIGNINNAQANLLMFGLLLLGWAALAQERWKSAGAYLALACLIKLYPVAAVMLLLLIYPRRLGFSFIGALVVGLALPFLLHQPEYVARQYGNWLANLRTDDRTQWVVEASYRDLWLLFRNWHVPVTTRSYLVIQLMAAAGIALVTLALRWRGVPSRLLLNAVLGLAVCWMTVCGPTTESSTYCLLGPTLAWAVVAGWQAGSSRFALGLSLVSYAIFMLTHVVSAGLYGPAFQALAPQPLAGLLLFTGLLIDDRRLLRVPKQSQPPVRIRLARAA